MTMDYLSDILNFLKNLYVYYIIPSSLFTTIFFFKWAKTVCRQEPRASFCGILNELRSQACNENMAISVICSELLILLLPDFV